MLFTLLKEHRVWSKEQVLFPYSAITPFIEFELYKAL